MIRYRQKIFFLPLLINGALVGSSIYGIKQQKDSDKQSAEESDRQAELMKEQNRRLENIAEKVSTNPSAVGEIPGVMQNQPHEKFYGIINPNTIKNGKLFFKDMVGLANRNKGKVAGLFVSGLGMGGAGYVANKYIQHDLKRNGMEGVMTGQLPPDQEQNQQRSYAVTAGSVLTGIKKGAKFGAESLKKNWKQSALWGLGLTAVPAVMQYHSDKRAVMDQMNNTQGPPQERQYGVSSAMRLFRINAAPTVAKAGKLFKGAGNSIKGIGTSIKNGAKTFWSHPLQSTLGGISNFSMGGGKEGVKAVAEDLKANGKSSWTQAIAKKMTFRDKAGKIQPTKLALAASIPIGMGMMKVGWDGGQKAVEKTTRALDPNAYKYQDYKEKQAEMMQQQPPQYQ